MRPTRAYLVLSRRELLEQLRKTDPERLESTTVLELRVSSKEFDEENGDLIQVGL